MGSTILRWCAVGAMFAGCPGPGASATCQELCRLLIVDCGMAAYPDPASCEQGCLYEDAQGGDVHSLHLCVAEADCDTSLVLECSRAFGTSP